jgi:hypothetical protein
VQASPYSSFQRKLEPSLFMIRTSGTVNFSTDPKQSRMYAPELVNDVIYVMNRQNLTELTRIGGGGRQAG